MEGGLLGVEAPAAAPWLEQGRAVRVTGAARIPREWERDLWRRQGVARVLAARHLQPAAGSRGGITGALDGVRDRAREALESGTGEAPAALLRGFVLGEDDLIAEPVREDFRRSGLAHLLAVSGQNVMLLAILALPLLGLLGLSLRARLLGVLALIAVYVPVAGAGPSIQRAGVMGAAGIVAMLASRPRSGWYALLLGAAVTLTLDPLATSDIGWQLSFAAVAGLFLLARPLATLLAGGRRNGPRRALAEGAALTLAASAATAPLVAHHFGTVSLTALPANLLALPAVAPAMWLGMLAGALGQLPGAPAEPLSLLGGLCAGYVGWVAQALGGPWAQLDVAAPGVLATGAWTAGLTIALALACAALTRRRSLGPRPRMPPRRLAFAAALALALLAALAALPAARREPSPPPRLELRVLDVGQGDAILLRPRAGEPILVDTGPPGSVVARLEELGVDELAALVVTHDQLDHSGGLAEVLEAAPPATLVTGPGPAPAACRRGLECPPLDRVAAGDRLRAGGLRLDVLWPPPGVSAAHGDPNASSLVLLARHGSFEALLTGDAEAELAAYDPGPVDLLKVAHHGSADAGLAELLERTEPGLAAISVGADNPFGHPAPETLADLAADGVPVRRTDQDGEVAVVVGRDGWTVE